MGKTQQTVDGYEVRDGRIVSPGKFEGEPVWAPYFYEALLDGGADEDDGEVSTFEVTDDDRAEHPTLRGVIRVRMWVRDDGFVCTDTDTEPSGYMDCSCRDCFEGPIMGCRGDMCDGCVEAGCELDSECQRADAYGCGEETE